MYNQEVDFFLRLLSLQPAVKSSLRVFFLRSALADDFSLESDWRQVSSGLQDSSQYSGRS